jgi:cardiolipin synthase C
VGADRTTCTPRPRSVSRYLAGLALAVLLGSCASIPKAVERPPSHAVEAYATAPLGRLVARRQPRSDVSGFRLLVSGDRAYRARLALVDEAVESLDLQYYVVERDDSTRELFAHVRRASERGVRVRLLLDDLNTVSRDAGLARFASRPNVQVRLFNPFPAARSSLASRFLVAAADLPRLTRRMHNKLLVADNAVAIAGGRNLGAAYFDGPGDVAFADLDVLVAGPVVRSLSESFDHFWNSELTYPIGAVAGAPANGVAGAPAPVTTSQGAPPAGELLRELVWARGHVLADRPTKVVGANALPADSVHEDVLAIVARAKRTVSIVSPYFIPDDHVMEVLRDLRRRGVSIGVLTNSLATTDMPMAHAAYARYRVELLALGVQLYELRTGPGRRGGLLGSSSRSSKASLHAKAVLVDDRVAVVGSMNLDPRSAQENTEVGVVIDSGELGARMARLFAQGIEPEASYTLRLEPDGRTLQWVTRDSGADRVRFRDPEAGWWRALSSVLLRVIVPEAAL